ncbi:hypothetical protein [Candidatus Desulfovibrio trichonymphae]|uniref:hypothetical protein n=1 Tax=Candidatus Desulfovibrio trichonymphae TaxID=1725232 RepID=UPI001557EA0C|nr:hypothetical protein [Candidatus Desulfovibrio trichonymphae]
MAPTRVLLMDEGKNVTRILAKRLAQAAAADGKEALDAMDALRIFAGAYCYGRH